MKLKPLDHYLRPLCSKQVQILLERMDDRFADEFQSYDSKWDAFYGASCEAYKHYTRVERFCVQRTFKRELAKHLREQTLMGIMERAISPAKGGYEFQKEMEKSATIFREPKTMIVNSAQMQIAKKLVAAQYAQHQNTYQK
jgi:hypothetical protein